MHRVITTINITQRGLTNNYTIIGLWMSLSSFLYNHTCDDIWSRVIIVLYFLITIYFYFIFTFWLRFSVVISAVLLLFENASFSFRFSLYN